MQTEMIPFYETEQMQFSYINRDTDKQCICVTTQLKKTFTQLKLKGRVLICRNFLVQVPHL